MKILPTLALVPAIALVFTAILALFGEESKKEVSENFKYVWAGSCSIGFVIVLFIWGVNNL